MYVNVQDFVYYFYDILWMFFIEHDITARDRRAFPRFLMARAGLNWAITSEIYKIRFFFFSFLRFAEWR